jgi:hypothetical protein
MAAYHGYDGGVTEPQLIAAAKQLLATEHWDVVKKTKTVYFVIGSIIEQAKEQGYAKDIGIKAWIVQNLGISHTSGYACLNGWLWRRDFDAAVQWCHDPQRNHSFNPKSYTGAMYAPEVIKAYRSRNAPDKKKKAKGKTKKELEALVAQWKHRYKEVRPIAEKGAEDDEVAIRTLKKIDLEVKQDDDDVFDPINPDDDNDSAEPVEEVADPPPAPKPEEKPKDVVVPFLRGPLSPRVNALILVVDHPEQWKTVASRVKGDVIQRGWVIMDNSGVPRLTALGQDAIKPILDAR